MTSSVQMLLRPRFTLPTLTLFGFGGVLLFTRVIASAFTPYAVIFVTLIVWLGFWAFLGAWFSRLRERLDWQDIARGCAYGFVMGWFGAYLSGQMTPLEALVAGGVGGAIASLVGNTFGYTPLAATCFLNFVSALGIATVLRFLTGELTLMGVFIALAVPLLFCYRIGVLIENTAVNTLQTPLQWLEDFIRFDQPQKTSAINNPSNHDTGTPEYNSPNSETMDSPSPSTNTHPNRPRKYRSAQEVSDSQLSVLFLMTEKRIAWKKISSLLDIDEKMAQRDLAAICQEYRKETRFAREVYLMAEAEGKYLHFNKNTYRFERTRFADSSMGETVVEN
jgi:hypothetical protein